ncbi:MAG: hypothetical protein HOA17_09900 [Candidatus Melainabacteria bacterium]|jgi:hypothetical protein|nr:hypothetical protein [Candidatus Melainabacteria bacterium]
MPVEFDKLSPSGQEARKLAVRTSAIASYGAGTNIHHLGEAIKTLHQVSNSANTLTNTELEHDAQTEINNAKTTIEHTISNLDSLVPGNQTYQNLLSTQDDSTGLATKINQSFKLLTSLLHKLHETSQRNLRQLVQTKTK